MIVWRPVTSSNVAAVGWPLPATESVITFVMFNDGRVYGYAGCSKQRAVYMATRCPSVGAYVAKVLKPNFQAYRIPELDVNGPPF